MSRDVGRERRPAPTVRGEAGLEERDRLAAAAPADAEARGRLIDEFMPAIRGIARHYRGTPGVSNEELIQEGVVGLLRAARRYQPRLGTPFWAYASWWVRQAMQQVVSELSRPFVLSDRAQRRLAQIKETRRAHAQAHRGEPTTSELAAEAGLESRQVADLLAVESAPRALDEPVGGEDERSSTLGDLVADPRAEEEYDRVTDRATMEGLRDLTAALDGRERAIVEWHYGLRGRTETLREIAGRLQLSVERVRQIEVAALGKIGEAAGA